MEIRFWNIMMTISRTRAMQTLCILVDKKYENTDFEFKLNAKDESLE